MKTQLPVEPMTFCVSVPPRWSTRPVVLAALPTKTSPGLKDGFRVMVQIFAGTVLIVGCSPLAVGNVAGFQLAVVFQAVLVPPTQAALAPKLADGRPASRRRQTPATAAGDVTARTRARDCWDDWIWLIVGLASVSCCGWL